MTVPMHVSQPSFAGGEISPSLHARVDLQKYATSLALARNFFVHPHGGASNRPGTAYVATAKYGDKKCRVLPFEFSTEQAYAIEMGHLYARFYMDGGQIQKTAIEYDPAAAHEVGECVKVGVSFTCDLGDGKKLYISKPFGVSDDVTSMSFASAPSDDINFAKFEHTIVLYLANATPAKNSADLIQAMIRSQEPAFSGYVVTENAEYAADRPGSSGIGPSWAPTTYEEGAYIALAHQLESDTNTGSFPPDEPSFWSYAADTSPFPYEVTTPYAEADLPRIKTAQSADVLFIAQPDHAPATLSRYAHDDWRLEDFDFKNGPFMPQNRDKQSALTVFDPADPAPHDIFSDDFEDGTLDKWTVTGSMSVETTYSSQRMTNRDTAGGWTLSANAVAAQSSAYGAWQFDVVQRMNKFAVDYADVRFIQNDTDYYSVILTGKDLATLKFTKNGTALATISYNGGRNVVSTLRIERTNAGVFNVFKNGSNILTLIDTSITTANKATVYLVGTNTSTTGTVWIDNFVISSGTTLSDVFLTPATGAVNMEATKPVFNADQVGAIFQVKSIVAPQAISDSAFTANTHISTSVRCGQDWSIITRGTWTGKLLVQVSVDAGATWETIQELPSAVSANYQMAGQTAVDQCLIRVRADDTFTWTGTAEVNLTSQTFLWSGIVKIETVTDSQHATVSVENETGVRNLTSTWQFAEGSWSDYRGYPACVAVYQDRVVFACTRSEPQTVWTSEIGDYYSFKRSSPLLDTDGVSVNLPSGKMNGIRTLSILDGILALTSASEWSVRPGADGALTPSTVTTKCHGYNGCSDVSPVIVGNRVVYVQPMGTVLQDLGYDLTANGFTGINLSIMAAHLFQNHEIMELAYQQEPDSIIWCVRDDGVLVAVTYMREQEVLACTWHDTDGEFESICTIPGEGYNEVWASVKRGSSRFIERLTKRMSSKETEDQYFVDCGLTYSGAPTTTISGLSHLEGQSVAILADGVVIPNRTVTNGAITLPFAASKVHVGLPYLSDLETLALEIPQADGTMQGRKFRVPQVTLHLLESVGGSVGSDADHLEEIVQRATDNLDGPVPLFTGHVKKTIPSRYGEGKVFIRQSDPLPITVLAVIPTVQVGG